MRSLRALLALLLLPGVLYAQASRDFTEGDRVTITGATSVIYNAAASSIVAWVYADGTATSRRIYSENEAAGIQQQMAQEAGTAWDCTVLQVGSPVVQRAQGGTPAAAWKCLICTFDSAGGGTITLYEDGVQVAQSTTWNGTYRTATPASVLIGDIANSGSFTFDGKIAMVAAFLRVLNEAERAEACYGNVAAISPTALWRLWGSTVTDEVGALDGTLTGTTAFAGGPPIFLPGGAQ